MAYLYKLLVYLPINGELHEIYSLFGEDEAELETIGLEHKSNNSEYVAMVVKYNPASVKVVEPETISD